VSEGGREGGVSFQKKLSHSRSLARSLYASPAAALCDRHTYSRVLYLPTDIHLYILACTRTTRPCLPRKCSPYTITIEKVFSLCMYYRENFLSLSLSLSIYIYIYIHILYANIHILYVNIHILYVYREHMPYKNKKPWDV
jgi:hypothetical protein